MQTIERALALFGDKVGWLRLVRAGMNQDLSWRNECACSTCAFMNGRSPSGEPRVAAPRSDVSISV